MCRSALGLLSQSTQTLLTILKWTKPIKHIVVCTYNDVNECSAVILKYRILYNQVDHCRICAAPRLVCLSQSTRSLFMMLMKTKTLKHIEECIYDDVNGVAPFLNTASSTVSFFQICNDSNLVEFNIIFFYCQKNN